VKRSTDGQTDREEGTNKERHLEANRGVRKFAKEKFMNAEHRLKDLDLTYIKYLGKKSYKKEITENG
jgi:hypothetical protein